jgi:hypothetical protein
MSAIASGLVCEEVDGPTVNSKCFVEGCGRKIKAHGLCNAHYQRSLAGTSLDRPINAVRWRGITCSVDGCDLAAVALGFCSTHWCRQRKGRQIDAPVYTQGKWHGIPCSTEGCELKVWALGFCRKHYKSRPDRPLCAYSACSRVVNAMGYCHAHAKYARLGLPLEPLGKYYLALEDFRAIARDRGGECLAESYTNPRAKAEWKCMNGHTWLATFGAIRNGKQWCPACGCGRGENKCRWILELMFGKAFQRAYPEWLRVGKRGKKLELDGYNEHLQIAFEYQGAQHYETGRSSKESVEAVRARDALKRQICWRRGVALVVIPEFPNLGNHEAVLRDVETALGWASVKIPRSWKKQRPTEIPDFWGQIQSRPVPDEAHRMAADRGGKCLSPEFVTANLKLEWSCAEGHRWSALIQTIRRSWCKRCSDRSIRIYTIDDARALAAERGGECLSESYQNYKFDLLWRCATGHEWLAPLERIKIGRWCRCCADGQRWAARRKNAAGAPVAALSLWPVVGAG